MSILDGEVYKDAKRSSFPESEEDLKKLQTVLFKALQDPQVQKSLVESIQNNPKATPDIVARMAAMLAQRIVAQVKVDFKVEMPPKNVVGLLLVIVSELYSMLSQMGSPPADDQLIQETAKIASDHLDEFNATQGPQRDQQVPKPQPQQQQPMGA